MTLVRNQAPRMRLYIENILNKRHLFHWFDLVFWVWLVDYSLFWFCVVSFLRKKSFFLWGLLFTSHWMVLNSKMKHLGLKLIKIWDSVVVQEYLFFSWRTMKFPFPNALTCVKNKLNWWFLRVLFKVMKLFSTTLPSLLPMVFYIREAMISG